KQLIFSIASLVVGGGLILLLYPYVGLTIAVYISIPVVAPIALGGFYSYQGMSFYEVMKRRFYFMFHNKPLTYVSTESVDELDKWNAEQKLKEKNKRKRGKRV
ncbi:MAG: PrgI family protein, partial [Tyzzerella sp.]|nr:PrgI family protein [Tyzzerella sp.]